MLVNRVGLDYEPTLPGNVQAPYRTWIDPFIVMLAGVALLACWDAVVSRNRRPTLRSPVPRPVTTRGAQDDHFT
jgi:hypothetical protein